MIQSFSDPVKQMNKELICNGRLVGIFNESTQFIGEHPCSDKSFQYLITGQPGLHADVIEGFYLLFC